jgi:hypothetical protein
MCAQPVTEMNTRKRNKRCFEIKAQRVRETDTVAAICEPIV